MCRCNQLAQRRQATGGESSEVHQRKSSSRFLPDAVALPRRCDRPRSCARRLVCPPSGMTCVCMCFTRLDPRFHLSVLERPRLRPCSRAVCQLPGLLSFWVARAGLPLAMPCFCSGFRQSCWYYDGAGSSNRKCSLARVWCSPRSGSRQLSVIVLTLTSVGRQGPSTARLHQNLVLEMTRHCILAVLLRRRAL